MSVLVPAVSPSRSPASAPQRPPQAAAAVAPGAQPNAVDAVVPASPSGHLFAGQYHRALAAGLAPPAQIGRGFLFNAPSLRGLSTATRLRSHSIAEMSEEGTFGHLRNVLLTLPPGNEQDQALALLERARAYALNLFEFPSREADETWREDSEDQRLRVGTDRELISLPVAELAAPRDELQAARFVRLMDGLVQGQRFLPLFTNEHNALKNGNHRLILCKALNIQAVRVLRYLPRRGQGTAEAGLAGAAPLTAEAARPAQAPASRTNIYQPPFRRAASEGADASAPGQRSRGTNFRPRLEGVEQSPPDRPNGERRFSPYSSSPRSATSSNGRAGAVGRTPYESPREVLAAGVAVLTVTPRRLTYGDEG